MKLLSHINLRLRITLLTGILLLFAGGALTTASMYNAHDKITQTADIIQVELKAVEAVRVSYAATIPAEDIVVSSTPQTASLPLTKVPMAKLTTAAPVESQVATAIPYTMTIAQTSRQFNLWSLSYTAIIVIIGMLLAYFFAGRAMRPVQQLSTAITGITEHSLQERLPAPKSRDEISQLTTAFNTMLDRLEESFWRQKQFSSNVAHELKTPLATMKAGIQVLRLEASPTVEEYQEVMAVTQRNVDRLIHVVDDLMTLTNEGYEEQMEPLCLDQLLHNILQELQAHYRKKEIAVDFQPTATETFILGGETLTCRLFANLIENAFKYNQPQGQLTVSLLPSEQMVYVVIADHGIGIPEEAQQRIFEPFYCVDASRSRKSGGAGLGLSIVKTIADQYGWSIDVQSQPARGTTFTVGIPQLAQE